MHPAVVFSEDNSPYAYGKLEHEMLALPNLATAGIQNSAANSIGDESELIAHGIEEVYAQMEQIPSQVGLSTIDLLKNADILIRKDIVTTEDVITARSLLVKAKLEIRAAIERIDETFWIKFSAIVYGVCTLTALLCLGIFRLCNGDFNGAALNNTFIGIPAFVWIWSAIGTVTAMMLRASEIRPQGWAIAMRWLMCRPVVGISTGVLLYLFLQAGVLIATNSQADHGPLELRRELLYLISYLGGFSDTISVTIIQRFMGQFTGVRDHLSDSTALTSRT